MTLEDIRQVWLSYYQPIRAGWKRILLFALLGVGIMLIPYFRTPKSYEAVTIFHPAKAPSQGGINSIAASFFGGDVNNANTEMIGILKSRNLGERVAADSVVYEGKQLPLAEVLHQYQKENASFSLRSLFLKKKKELTLAKLIINQGNSLKSQLNVKTGDHGFLEASFIHTEPKLAGLVSETYIKQLEAYYHHQKTEKAQKDLDYFTLQTQEAKRRLDSAQIALAYYYDSQKFNIYKKGELKQTRKQNEVQLLRSLYNQWKRALEDARSQLQAETPVIQVLDAPLPPYKVKAVSLKKQILMGLFLGIFFTSLWIVRKRLKADMAMMIDRALQGED